MVMMFEIQTVLALTLCGCEDSEGQQVNKFRSFIVACNQKYSNNNFRYSERKHKSCRT
jgi:hypothetical protein